MNLRRLAALAAVPVLGLGIALAGSGAAFASDNAKATIYTEPSACGGADNTSAPVAGFMNVHADGVSVSLNIHLKDAVPGDRYAVYAFESSNPCLSNSFLGFVTPNSNGVVNLEASFTLTNAGDSVFIGAFPLTGTTLESAAVSP